MVALAFVFLIYLSTSAVFPENFEVGQWVQLKAVHPAGVPLHRQSQSSMFDRAPDGSEAEIIDVANNGRWLKLRFSDGKEGWVVERYVEGEVSPPGDMPQVGNDEWLVWDSLQACKTVVEAGGRMAATQNEVLRVSSWNIRWFPDNTELEWLACTISWMNVDLLAVQEIRDTAQAQSAMQTVLNHLNTFTGNNWNVDLHQCGQQRSQHVGFIWNSNRVTLSGQTDLWQLNARADAVGSACEGSLRPGRYAYVQSTASNGVDFHAISVHSKSSATSSAQAERVVALGRLDQVSTSLLTSDEDIIVLGDFNTMGNRTAGSAETEVQNLIILAASEAPGFIRFDLNPACTEYYQGHAGWLDHVLVSQPMDEVPNRTARITGYCAVKSCADIGQQRPAAYEDLSDHCPLVFEIQNQDTDP